MRCVRFALLAAVVALTGCLVSMVSTADITLTPELIHRAPLPAAERVAGAVALTIAPGLKRTPAVLSSKASHRTVRVWTGEVAGESMRAALDDVLREGVKPIDSAAPTAARRDATVSIEAIRLAYTERQLRVEWKGTHVETLESSVTLAMDVSLTDARGGIVWIRTYEEDSAPFSWTVPSKKIIPMGAGLEAAVHEAAGRISQRAAADLRSWMQAERMSSRSL